LVAAGDVFHGGFALALKEAEALHFASAAAALKCTRFGGIVGTFLPPTSELERADLRKLRAPPLQDLAKITRRQGAVFG
jgi:hypothetical protein